MKISSKTATKVSKEAVPMHNSPRIVQGLFLGRRVQAKEIEDVKEA